MVMVRAGRNKKIMRRTLARNISLGDRLAFPKLFTKKGRHLANAIWDGFPYKKMGKLPKSKISRQNPNIYSQDTICDRIKAKMKEA
jgi:hypothetical protein